MSARRDGIVLARLKASVAAGACLLAQAGLARGVPDILEDPLLARPPLLDTGAVLPGDTTPVACETRPDFTQPLTLSEAVDLGLCHAPKISVAWAVIRQQAAAVGEARAAYLPTLTASVTGQRNQITYPGRPDADSTLRGHSSYAALNWRLFDFGERSANRQAANHLLASAMASYDAALQRTLGEIVGAYFDARTAQAYRVARGLDRQWAEQTLATATRRERLGAAGRNDTLQAQTALAKAQLEEQRAAGEMHKALATLVYALGVPAGTTVTLAVDSPAPAADAVDDLDHWLEFARRQHPAIVAAREQWEAAKAKITSTRSQGLPTLDFGVNWYQNGYPNQSLQSVRSNTTTIGLTLTIPLFEGFARTYKVREAQAQADQDEAQIEETEHQVLREVVQAYADAQSSLASLNASAMLLASAEAALTSSRNRYEHGVADIIELINAQTALADARQERIRSEAQWRSARLRLLADTGMLGRTGVSAGTTLEPARQ
ncbi:Protein CyaE (plasmid) [Paraburkholderia kururiensis]|uniref:TolC family protein n=1 Tax=Paraburkholderia kururiensis TaxID=984307 RepID=UPI0039A5BC1E